MADVLGLQSDDDQIPTPGESKASMLSYMYCHASAVSIVLCEVIKQR